VRPGVSWGRMRAVLRYAGSCLVFKYEFVAPDPRTIAPLFIRKGSKKERSPRGAR
jgi:hypothetical protein